MILKNVVRNVVDRYRWWLLLHVNCTKSEVDCSDVGMKCMNNDCRRSLWYCYTFVPVVCKPLRDKKWSTNFLARTLEYIRLVYPCILFHSGALCPSFCVWMSLLCPFHESMRAQHRPTHTYTRRHPDGHYHTQQAQHHYYWSIPRFQVLVGAAGRPLKMNCQRVASVCVRMCRRNSRWQRIFWPLAFD